MALIPKLYIRSVVAVGTLVDDEVKWIASGFLYGQFIGKVDEKTSRYIVYFVTNRHVLVDLSNVMLRFNPQGSEPAKEFPIPFSGDNSVSVLYHPNEDVDLAAVRLNPEFLRERNIDFDYVRSDGMVASLEVSNEEGLSEGDLCFMLGFPMGLIGQERSYVICRHGNIARISDFLGGHSGEILIDCMNYPGNSGGPVVTKPEFMKVQGTKSQKVSYLLGIVQGYIAYRDTAVSLQTGKPRVTFEENSGLTRIVPAHVLKEWFDSLPEHDLRTEDSVESIDSE